MPIKRSSEGESTLGESAFRADIDFSYHSHVEKVLGLARVWAIVPERNT
jgi:hypothetical protein